MRRTLYIDGSNLFGGISELLPAGNYIDFPSLLAVLEEDLAIDTVKFYATYMRYEASSPTTHQSLYIKSIENLNRP